MQIKSKFVYLYTILQMFGISKVLQNDLFI